MTKDKVISYLTDPLCQAPRRLIRALIEKIIVFDDKILIFFQYTKTSPEVNPWEMPAYPGSDSSNMVDLRRVLRATCYSQLLSRSARCARAAIKCSAVLTKKVDFC